MPYQLVRVIQNRFDIKSRKIRRFLCITLYSFLFPRVLGLRLPLYMISSIVLRKSDKILRLAVAIGFFLLPV